MPSQIRCEATVMNQEQKLNNIILFTWVYFHLLWAWICKHFMVNSMNTWKILGKCLKIRKIQNAWWQYVLDLIFVKTFPFSFSGNRLFHDIVSRQIEFSKMKYFSVWMILLNVISMSFWDTWFSKFHKLW